VGQGKCGVSMGGAKVDRGEVFFGCENGPKYFWSSDFDDPNFLFEKWKKKNWSSEIDKCSTNFLF